MIFSRHRRIDPKRRFGSKDFQNKIKQAQSYKRSYNPIDLNRPNKWMVLIGFKSKFFRVLWIGLVAAIVYFFVFSNYLIINRVEVNGLSRVSSSQVSDLVQSLANQRTAFVPKSNFFLMTKSRMEKTLTAAIPLVKEIKSYKRGWPNKVRIEIVERDPGFILQVGEKQYLVDEEGIVVKDDTAGLILPIVIDQVQENFDIGKPLPNPKMVAFILSIHKQWGTKISSRINLAKIPGKASNEVQIVSSEGWGVFFDTSRPVTSQLDNLALVLSRQIPAKDRLNLAYIDMRLEKWAYYCFKDTPCVAGAQEELKEAEIEPGVTKPTPPPPSAGNTNAPKL